jgi:hypothetical protein
LLTAEHHADAPTFTKEKQMPAAHPAGADNRSRGSGDGYLTERQFCERYRVSARTAQRWRVTGDGPPFVRLGPHKIVYRLSDAETWAAGRTFAHRADGLSRTIPVKARGDRAICTIRAPRVELAAWVRDRTLERPTHLRMTDRPPPCQGERLEALACLAAAGKALMTRASSC